MDGAIEYRTLPAQTSALHACGTYQYTHTTILTTQVYVHDFVSLHAQTTLCALKAHRHTYFVQTHVLCTLYLGTQHGGHGKARERVDDKIWLFLLRNARYVPLPPRSVVSCEHGHWTRTTRERISERQESWKLVEPPVRGDVFRKKFVRSFGHHFERSPWSNQAIQYCGPSVIAALDATYVDILDREEMIGAASV